MQELSERQGRITFLVLVVGIAGVVGLSTLTGASGESNLPRVGITYSINGITCGFPKGTPNYVANVVEQLTTSQRFKSAIGSTKYVFASFDNVTQREQTEDNVTTHLPDSLELGFSNRGASTWCGEGAQVPFDRWLDVNVPIINGTFNVGTAEIIALGGNK